MAQKLAEAGGVNPQDVYEISEADRR